MHAVHLLARLRHLLARRPWLYWLAVAVLAAAAGVVATRSASSVDAARERWGTTLPVVAARGEQAPGDELAGRVELRDRPAPMVPDDALTELDGLAAGAVARQRISAGEIVVAPDVAATAAPQLLIPAGWSAVAVAEAVPSGAVVGDTVGVAGSGALLATAAVVVGRVGDATLVAVPDRAAAAVATAAASGDVSLLLRP